MLMVHLWLPGGDGLYGGRAGVRQAVGPVSAAILRIRASLTSGASGAGRVVSNSHRPSAASRARNRSSCAGSGTDGWGPQRAIRSFHTCASSELVADSPMNARAALLAEPCALSRA